MADDQHYDVVIIGTGAGGGTLGHRLATNGVKTLWLERGPFLPNPSLTPITNALRVDDRITERLR
jgi:choline dehydrogenase-like flavoprotein